MSTFVGIDIAAKTVDPVVRQDDKNSPVKTFQQTPSGRAILIEFLHKNSPEFIVMEATGIYYLDLAIVLYDAKMPISVINPKSFNYFAHMKLVHSKTDSIDAALLAEYSQRIRLIRQFNNLLAAKGVGEVLAIVMLGELTILPETLKANQISRYAGVDVRLNKFESSLNRPGRLSRAGSTYLRCALFMPAMSAVRHDPNAKAFYQALVA